MNSGSFFHLDLETSKIVSGVTFYEYIDLPDLTVGVDGLRYPVKVTITQDRVSFFVHYYDEDSWPRHSEEVILDLPYWSNNTEALSSIIKRVYNTTFPLSDYLQSIIEDRYDNDKIRVLGGKTDKYDLLKKSQINKESYSSLYIWGLTKSLEAESDDIWYKLYSNNGEEEKQITKFLRKLLLDFMFDLMHSDVFESSKYYTQMREGLMNDFFFSAIVKKSEYYYQRRLVRSRCRSFLKNKEINHTQLDEYIDQLRQLEAERKRLNLEENRQVRKCQEEKLLKAFYYGNDHNITRLLTRLQHISLKKHILTQKKYILDKNEKQIMNEKYQLQHNIEKTIKSLYTERLDETECEWINVIMSPMAEKHFVFRPEWYERQINKTQKEEDIFNISESWFVDPEEEMRRIVFPKENNHKKGIHYLNSSELSKLLGTGDNSAVVNRNTNISKWFYHRFNFKDTYRLHFFNGWNKVFFVLLILLFIYTIISIFYPCLWSCPSNFSFITIIGTLGCLLSSRRLKKKYEKNLNDLRDKGIDDYLLINRLKREHKQSIVHSIVFLLFSVFLISFGFCKQYEIIKPFLLITLIFFILFLFFKSRSYKINNIHLLLPRLVASITTAWIMLVIGNDLVKEHISWPVCIIVTIIVFSFILYENNKTLNNIVLKEKAIRAIWLILISFSISLIIGIFAIDVLTPSMLIDAKDYKLPLLLYNWNLISDFKELSLTIFPKYLIQFSFLAMFIGVFIQMIFEEKNITEM